MSHQPDNVFAGTQVVFLKESPRRVKPLLYVYRVLLTGIHLMRTGAVEANLVLLNQDFRLPYIADLVARKLAGPEKSKLEDADIAPHEPRVGRAVPSAPSFRAPAQLGGRGATRPTGLMAREQVQTEQGTFHEAEYQRLRGELQAAHEVSSLPEMPGAETRAALNDLLIRLRTKGLGCAA